MTTRPPLEIEAAIDVILAAAAHRSSNPAHREFGKAIFDRYFIELRSDWKDDLVARGYIDQLVPAMASAVRAFSVIRDMFGTDWQTLQKHRDHELERANRILDYSPFKEKGYWGKAFGIAGGSGGALAIKAGVAHSIHNATWVLVAIGVLGAVIGLLVFEGIIDKYHDTQISKIETSFPEELRREWETRTLTAYRTIIKQFLLNALLIQSKYYPDTPMMFGNTHVSADDLSSYAYDDQKPDSAMVLDKLLARIVERHLAFSLGRS